MTERGGIAGNVERGRSGSAPDPDGLEAGLKTPRGRRGSARGLLVAMTLLFAMTTAVAAPSVRRARLPARKLTPAPPASAQETPRPRMTVSEARMAVRILNDAYQEILVQTHAAYPTAPGRPAAAAVVRRLQEVMAEKGWPESRFLVVNAILRNYQHRPHDAFEQRASRALRSTAAPVEAVEDGRLRVAIAVPMDGNCTECHWTEEAQAGRAAITWNIPVSTDGK